MAPKLPALFQFYLQKSGQEKWNLAEGALSGPEGIFKKFPGRRRRSRKGVAICHHLSSQARNALVSDEFVSHTSINGNEVDLGDFSCNAALVAI